MSSTWNYPDLPWQQGKIAEQQEAAENLHKKKITQLEARIRRSVRSRFYEEYPEAFDTSEHLDLLTTTDEGSMNPILKTLLKLNGYEKVPLAKASDVLPLAEGVVAMPYFYSRLSRSRDEKYWLLRQPMDSFAYPPFDPKKKRPLIIQQDITIYRTLESYVDRFLAQRYEKTQAWFSNHLQKADKLLTSTFGKRIQTSNPPKDGDLSSVETHRIDSDANTGSDARENLLVLGGRQKSCILLTDMTEETRLLALPHSFGHKGASTLISVSLVAFGALPLAYRSMSYFWLYPEVVALSLIGTVSYGIYSSRWTARTSQARAVTYGMYQRVYAQDDAVRLVLQDGAIERVTQAVVALFEYHTDRKRVAKKSATEIKAVTPKNLSTNAIRWSRQKEEKPLSAPILPQLVLDPETLGLELGVLVEASNEGKDDEKGERGVEAVPIDILLV